MIGLIWEIPSFIVGGDCKSTVLGWVDGWMEDDDDDHKEREFYPKRENATAHPVAFEETSQLHGKQCTPREAIFLGSLY